MDAASRSQGFVDCLVCGGKTLRRQLRLISIFGDHETADGYSSYQYSEIIDRRLDTYKSEVSAEAIANGVSIVNDVSALRFDPALAAVVARGGAALVLMHMRGEPATMQSTAPSSDIFDEIESDLKQAIRLAESQGVSRDLIIIDPGIGFGKSLDQNLAILNHLNRFEAFNLPLMIGTSRKSFIGRITGPESARTFGTAASVAIGIMRGAHLIRVHDVKQMVEVSRIADAISAA